MTAQAVGCCMLVLAVIAAYLDCASRWGYLGALWLFIKVISAAVFIFTAFLLAIGEQMP